MADGTDTRILLGVVTAPHGVKGLVRIKSFTAEPKDLAGYGPLADKAATRSFAVDVVGQQKGVMICRIGGIEDRDAAEGLRGTELFVDRARLAPLDDPDEFYQTDLVGLAAMDGAGTRLGYVKAVLNFGGGDMLEIELDGSGRSVLLPFSREAVPEIKMVEGWIRVDAEALAELAANARDR